MSHINLARLNPYELHKHLFNEYYLKKPGDTKQLERDKSKDKTDLDVIRENHKFLWEPSDAPDTWEKQLAKRYYEKLFKEYCICDLGRYKENKVALRWRIEKEVVIGKGQFICGNKTCMDKSQLRSWEVNFGYTENGEKKNALIKVRLCTECSKKLNYHSKKREIRRSKKCRKNTVRRISASTVLDTVKNESDDKIMAKDSQQNDEQCPGHDGGNQSDDLSKSEVHAADKIWTKGNSINANSLSIEFNFLFFIIFLGPEVEDKSREKEFDEYLENLLL